MPFPEKVRFAPLFLLTLFLLSSLSHGMDLISIDNGMSLILEERPGSNVVAAQFWVKVGSKYEDSQNAGVTHFIEHLIFKGSERLKPGQVASLIESFGGSINAFTSYENTVYHVVIPKDSFLECLPFLIDAIFNPIFPEEEIEKERRVILEEIKMGEDDPQRKIYKELFSLSYADHPYGRPIIGYVETVSRLSRKDIVSYFEDLYSPEVTTLVIVGDFEKGKVIDYLKSELGKLKGRKKRISYEKKDLVQMYPKTKVIEKDVLEGYLAISYPVPSILHEDVPTLEILSALLTEGESSRLNLELKNKKGIITGASSFLFAPEEEGLFVISVNFDGRDYQRVVDEIEREIKRLSETLEDWELRKAKNQVVASYVYAMETAQGRARTLGHFYTLTGDVSFVDRFLKMVEEKEKEDVRRTIEKYFLGGIKNVVVILPRANEKEKNPAFGELKNGLRYVVNENRSNPSFSFTVAFVGGVKDEPKGKNGLFNVLSRMLLKGTKRQDAFELAKAIDSLGGQMNPFPGYNLFGLSGKFLSKDFEEVMKILHEILTEAHFREEELKNVKNEVLSELRLKDDDPLSFAFRKFNSFFYEGHPYEKDPHGSYEDVHSITIEDLRKAYEEHVTPRGCVLSISGDVDVKEAKRIIEDLFSKWDGPERNLRREIVPKRNGYRYFEKNILQAHMVIGFPGVSLSDKDRFAVEVMDAVLSGMGGRIHSVLREENPYAYAVSFFNHMGYDTGAIGIYAAFDPKMLNEVKETVKKEIERILRNGFSDEEIERAKKYLVGNYLISIQSNKNISYRMAIDTHCGLGPNFFKKWADQIKRVTKEEVIRVAKEYLSMEKAAFVVIGKEF